MIQVHELDNSGCNSSCNSSWNRDRPLELAGASKRQEREIMGVKELLRRFLHKSSFFALLIVFSSAPITCDNGLWFVYDTAQLAAMQALWGAWNQSTPELEKNLPGWSSSVIYPCSQEYAEPHPNWHGVECLNYVNCVTNTTTNDESCGTYITGLTLDNAFLVGSLPREIGDISTLTTLALTGNPKLTGTLPDTVASMTDLYNVDLHDNGFSGEIPDFQFLQNVDLSGNQFKIINGSFPLSTMRQKGFAQKVILGRNDFEGRIPEDAFSNMGELVQLDLSNNRFNGTPPTLSNVTNLQILDLSNNSFSGTPPDLRTMSSLRSVNLSRNAFTGSALDFWNSSELQELYLDYNFLNGSLDITGLSFQDILSSRSPDSYGQLKVLSLTYNNISNVKYNVSRIEDITTDIRLQGNPYCKYPDSDDGTRCFCTQVCKNQAKNTEDKRKIVIIAVVTSVSSLLLFLVGLVAVLYRNNRYKQYLQLQVQQKFEEFEVKPTIFPYNQLRIATRDFHPDMKLGQGSFGAVYKGILPNGNVVAVKQLFAKTAQGVDEFLNEVILLTGMKHRNLVNLKGCCIREQQRLLVYEYVDNYDIDQVLLSKSNRGTSKALLSWPVRLKICLGVARGLQYLHTHAQPRIIHRDIKASNILLAKNYETKIADFGLAFLFPDEASYILTKHVAGTKGYLAPEYASLGQLSDKVDIFSFGVLCLEVVSGRRNIDERLAPNEMYLSKLAWDLHRHGSLMDLVDPTMSLQFDEKAQVHRLINIALLCIQNEAEQRPSIERVVAMLQGEGDLEAVVPRVEMEEQDLERIRLFAVGRSELATVIEDSESSFRKSSRKGMDSPKEGSSTTAMLQLSEIRVR